MNDRGTATDDRASLQRWDWLSEDSSRIGYSTG